jgi:predicted amidophosphoribosyltransferase
MGYKEAPVDEARQRFARRVSRLFADFFVTHQTCLAEATRDGVDLILPVPSTSRPGRASLEAVGGLDAWSVSSVGAGATWAPRVLQRAEGEIGHMRPNARAFAVPDPWCAAVRGSRVLLLDDTYVSGARAQSAAAALRRSGARSILVVPLGRVIRPERFAAHAAFMNGQPTGAPAGDGHRPRCLLVQTGAGKG